MERRTELSALVEDYRARDAARDQQALVALLREIQALYGGVIPQDALAAAAAGLGLKETFLAAVVKRFPSLRTEEAPHRLELCGGERCRGRGSARLAAFVERTYGVKPGGVSRRGGFSYRVGGCMKNCGRGPSLRWDGALHACADEALIRRLIEGGAPGEGEAWKQ